MFRKFCDWLSSGTQTKSRKFRNRQLRRDRFRQMLRQSQIEPLEQRQLLAVDVNFVPNVSVTFTGDVGGAASEDLHLSMAPNPALGGTVSVRHNLNGAWNAGKLGDYANDFDIDPGAGTAYAILGGSGDIYVNLGAGADSLTIDMSGGLIDRVIHFDGGAGTDLLQLTGTPSGTVTGNYATGLAGSTDGFKGTVTYTAGALTQTVNFDNLEPVEDLTVAASLTINDTTAVNVMNFVQGPGSTLLDPITGLSELTYQVNFAGGAELYNFRNKATVTLNGNGGADVITLNQVNHLSDSLAVINLLGGLGDDIVNVTATPPTTDTYVDTQVGVGDTINIGFASPNFGSGTLDNIAGNVFADDSGGVAVLNVDDSTDGTQDAIIFTSTTITGASTGVISYGTIVPNSIVAVELRAGTGNDTIDVNSTLAAATSTIKAGLGNDTINLGLSGTVNGIQGALFLEGNDGNDDIVVNDNLSASNNTYVITSTTFQRTAPSPIPTALVTYATAESLTLNAGTGNDEIAVNSTLATTPVNVNAGAGADNVRVGLAPDTLDNIASLVTVDGGAGPGNDWLFVLDESAATNHTYTVTPTSVTRDDGVQVDYNATIERLAVYGADADTAGVGDTFNVTPSTTTIYSLFGNDPAVLFGDTLIYNGSGTKTITGQGSGIITSPGFQPVNFFEFETVSPTGTFDDVIDFTQIAGGEDTLPNSVRLVLDATGTWFDVYVDTDTTDNNPEVLFVRELFAQIGTVTVTGGADNDTLIVDHTNGLINRTIYFNGNGQTGAPGDKLVITGTPAGFAAANPNARETYVVGADQFSGTWVIDPNDNRGPGIVLPGDGDEMTVIFTGLEPVDTDTAVAVFDVIMSEFGDNATIVNGTPLSGAASLRVVDNSGTFETFQFANKTTARIMGYRRSDAFRINYTTAAQGLTDLEIYGHLALDVPTDPLLITSPYLPDDNSAESFELDATDAITTSVFGQNGVDTFHNNGWPLYATGPSNMQSLNGIINIDGGAGTDGSYLSDTNSAVGQQATLTNTQLTGAAPAVINYTNLETFFYEASSDADTIDILSTQLGTSYYITGNGGADIITIGNQTLGFNTVGNYDGTLIGIQGDILLTGEYNPISPGADDTINVDASGDLQLAYPSLFMPAATMGINPGFVFNNAPFGYAESGPATELIGFAPAAIRYRHTATNVLPDPLYNNRIEFLNVLGSQGDDVIEVNATTATNTTTFDTREGADHVTIAGDSLSANNLFRGEGDNPASSASDQFTVNISAHLGQAAFALIQSLQIEGNDPAVDTNNRDRLTINDNNGAFVRNLNYDYLDTAGDLDILANVAGAGLAGANNPSMPVNVRSMETLIFNGAGGNDIVRVTGTSADDLLTVALLPSGAVPGAIPANPDSARQTSASNSAMVFLGGNPYLSMPGAGAPGDTLEDNVPGLAGGGTGTDILINGISNFWGVTLDGSGTGAGVVSGNRAIVQAASESPVVDPVGTLDIFGFGVGTVIPGFGAGGAFDNISVNNFISGANRVTAFNTGQAALLVPVAVAPASFVNTDAPGNQPRPGLVVNAGDEAGVRTAGPLAGTVADDIYATAHGLFNIQINGNLPVLGGIAPDGLPAGDRLNLSSPTSFSIWSDKETPPNVSIFAGNDSFGVVSSSIERTALLPGNGVVNLVGDNNDETVDQNDNFVVVGRSVDGDLLDGGYQEATVEINGSAPILIEGLQFLNVYGFDLVGVDRVNPVIEPKPDVPATGDPAQNFDTLDIRPYADDTPRGWGVDVTYNEGFPYDQDGAQLDLLIYRTSLFGGEVSEAIVIQPSGPLAGEISVTNLGFGTPIVDIDFVGNLDIIVLDDDGFPNDTDTLTLRGTDPANPGSSGNDTFDINFGAAGDVANPMVIVTDTSSATQLYRLRTIDDAGNPTFTTVNFESLGGTDVFNVTPDANVAVFIDAANPIGALQQQGDTLNVITGGAATAVTLNEDLDSGTVTVLGLQPVTFTNIERLQLDGRDYVLPTQRPTIDLPDANDTGWSHLDNVTYWENSPGDQLVPFVVTAEVGTTVVIKDGNTIIDGPYVSTGSDVRILNLGNGTHKLSAEASDAGNNERYQSEELIVTIDRLVPAAPADFVMLDASDTNIIGDDITYIRPVAIAGTGEPNARIRLYASLKDPVTHFDLDGDPYTNELIGQGVVNTDGTWEITVEPLRDGHWNIYGLQEDLAGNISPLATELRYLNYVGPAVAVPDATLVPGDVVTSSTILINLDGNITSVVVNFDPSVPPPTVGVTHASPTDLTMTLTSPAGTTVTFPFTGNTSYSFTEFNGEVTTSGNGGVWVLTVQDTVAGNAGTLVDWTISIATDNPDDADILTTANLAIPDAVYTPGVLVTSTINVPVSVVINALTATTFFSILDPLAALSELEVILIAPDNVTTYTLADLVNPNSPIDFNGMDSLGTWTLTIQDLVANDADPTPQFQLDQWLLDIEYVVGALNIEIDNTAPQRPTMDLPTAFDTGSSAFDNITYTADPVPFTVTADPGTTVIVKNGNTILELIEVNGVAQAPGTTSFVSTGSDTVAVNLSDGTYLLSAESMDVAGNISHQSEELVVEIDRVAPLASAPTLAPYSDTGVLGDFLTSIQQPAFIGTAEPNSLVRVYANGVLVGQGVATSQGEWEITVEPLADGEYAITTEVEDLAGNIAIWPPSQVEPLTITIDSEGPQRPTMDLLAANDSGSSNLDNVTNWEDGVGNQLVPFTVTADVGTTVVVKAGNTILELVAVNGIVQAAGTTSFVSTGSDVVTLTLAEGTYLLSAEATDDADNVSHQSEELVVVIDRSAPAASAPSLAPYSDTGVTGDLRTSIQQPAFTGTAEPNALVRVYADGVLAGQGVATSQGEWEITIEPLADGAHNITTTVEDLAGNVSAGGGPLTITIDTVAPQRPTIDLPAASDSGRSNLDNVTAALNDVPFTVTADAGTSVVIKNGNDIIDSFTMVGTSTVRTLTLAEGTHLLSVESTDDAGNISHQSAELIVVIDRTDPAASAPSLAPYSDTGIAGDFRTSIRQPAFTGTAEPNALVRVYADGVLVGQGVATSQGAWEITVEPLADGEYDITTIVEDLAGNVSAASAALTITIDALAPQRPTMDLLAVNDSGSSNLDNVTNWENAPGNQQVPFTVTADAGTAVVIKNGNDVIDSFTMVGTSIVRTLTLAEGTYLLSVESTDDAGNVSHQSEELVVVIDRTAPAASAPSLAPYSDSGVVGDLLTSIHQPAFVGTAEPNALVRVYANGVLVGQGVATSQGDWEITVEPLVDGVHLITTEVEDLAGNITASDPADALRITIDSGAPQRPTIDLLDADDTGWSSLDNVTRLTTPRFVITADAGTTVVIKDGNTVVFGPVSFDVLDALDGTDGTYTVTYDFNLVETNLGIPAEGTHLLSVEAWDSAGNVSHQSEELVVTIDATAPLVPYAFNMLDASDTGVIGDDITSIRQPAIEGWGEPNARIRIYAALKDPVLHNDIGPRELIGQGVVNTSGHWEITVEPLRDGHYNIYGEQEDLAGNVSELALDVRTLQYTGPGTLIDDADVGQVQQQVVLSNQTYPTQTIESLSLSLNITHPDISQLSATLSNGIQTIPITLPVVGSVALPAFIGDPVAAAWELTVTDSVVGLAGMLNSWSLSMTFTGGGSLTTSAQPPAAIPDAVAGIPAVSVINVPDSVSIIEVRATPNYNHPDPTELIVTLESPSGTIVGVPVGGGVYTIDFDGQDSAGLWTLTIVDNVPGNAGSLTDWLLEIDYEVGVLNIQIDNTQPQRPTIDLVDTYDTGVSRLDNVTKLNELLFTVTSDAGAYFVIKDGNTVIYPASGLADFDALDTDSDGRIQILLTLADGAHPLSVHSFDDAGNLSAQSEELLVTVDSQVPLAPANFDLVTSSDSGDSNSDDTTAIRQPAITGTGEPNSLIRLYAALKDPVYHYDITVPQLIGEGVVNSSGVWEITVEPLIDGHYNIYGEVEDLAGNISPWAFQTRTLSYLGPGGPIPDPIPGVLSVTPTLSAGTGAGVVTSAVLNATLTVGDTSNLIASLTSGAGTIIPITLPANGGAFSVPLNILIGERAEGTWTFTIEDIVPGGLPQLTLDSWSLSIGIALDVGGTLNWTPGDTTDQPIPDAIQTGPAYFVIGVPAPVTITGVGVWPTFNHPALGELLVELQSPATTQVNVGTSGGSFSNYNGENAYGYWTLIVTDLQAYNAGALDHWWLDIRYTVGALNIQIDGTAPQRPTLDLQTVADSGASDLDNVTNADNPVPFTATTDPGATVVIKDGNTVIDAFTMWSFALSGEQEVTPILGSPATGSAVVVLDLQTNLLSWEITFSDLTGAPTAAHFHAGAFNQNGPVVVNLGAPTGNAYIGSTTLTQAQADALLAGSWYVNIHTAAWPAGEIRGQVSQLIAPLGAPAGGLVRMLDLDEGTHLLSVESTDPSGNISHQSEELVVTVDRTAPPAVAPILAPYSDTGALGDGITGEKQPAFYGTTEPNAFVRIYANGVLAGEAQAGADGLWEITLEPLVDGDYVITADFTDLAGNTSVWTDDDGEPLTLTIDSTQPQRPTIDLLDADDTGVSHLDNVTNLNELRFTVTSDVGSYFVIKDGNTVIYPVDYAVNGPASFDALDVDSDGRIEVVLTLADGAHPLSVHSFDDAGNRSAQSMELLVTVDSVAPVGTVPTLAIFADSGVVGDGVTIVNPPAFVGTAEPNAFVRLYANGELVGQGVATAGGVWEITIEPLASNAYAITAVVEDLAGNVSVLSDPFALLVDPIEPNDEPATATVLGSLPKITLNDILLHSDTDVDFFQYTAAHTGMLILNAFSADPDVQVEVWTIGGAQTLVLVATGSQLLSGKYVDSLAMPVVGQQQYFIRVLYGGSTLASPVSYDLEIENFASPVPNFVVLEPADDTGSSNLDNVTSPVLVPTLNQVRITIEADLTGFWQAGIPMLSAADAANGLAGAAVEVFVDGVSVGFADPVPGSNYDLWSFTLDANDPLLADGLRLVKGAVRIFDGLGSDRSTLSVPLALTLDRVAPLIPQGTHLLDASNTGLLTDNITSIQNPAIAGTGEPNALVRLYAIRKDPVTHLEIPGAPLELIGQGLVTTTGEWEITIEPLADGHYNLYARQEDLAGNISPLTLVYTGQGGPIPDAVVGQISSSVELSSTTVPNPVLGVSLLVDLSVGDTTGLTATLTSPSGTVMNVPLPAGGGVFTVPFANDFDGEPAFGFWTFEITDSLLGVAPLTLNSWDVTVQTSSITVTPTTNVGAAIPDVTPGTASFIINVPVSAIINWIVVDATISHPDLSELVVTLTSPEGTVVDVDLNSLAQLFTDHFGENALGDWTLTITDNVPGNVGELEDWMLEIYTGIYNLHIDATAPQRPTINLVNDDDSGRSDLDNVTYGQVIPTVPGQDATVDFTVTGEAGATVVVKNGNTVIHTFDPFPGGTQTITLTLPEGTHLLSTEATDAAGNRSHQSQELVVTVDTTAPAAIIDTALAPYSDSGTVGDGLTAIRQPAFVGTAEPNALVRVYANGVLVGQGVATSQGDWEITVEPLVDGQYAITTEVEDLAGNITASDPEDSLVITIDGLGPQRPTIDLVNADDTGWSQFDNVTIGSPVQGAGIVDVRVTGDPGEDYVVKDGNTVIASGTIPASGQIVLTLNFNTLAGVTGFPAQGPHPLSVELIDAAGNVSHQSEELLITIDFTAPAAPLALNLLTSSDTFDNLGFGTSIGSSTDNITNIQQPAFNGTGEPNARVRVLAGGVVVGQGVVDPDGNWEVTVEPLADGTYSITAVLEDQAGNVSAPSQALSITVDTMSPQRPTLDLPTASDSGWSSLDNVTNAGSPISFTVTAQPGSRVLIKNGETVIDDFIMVGSSMSRPLAFASNGTYLLSAEAFDAAGNRSAQSQELVLTVDRALPAAPAALNLLTSSDTFDNVAGLIGPQWTSTDNVTFIRQPAFDGTGEPNARVRVLANGVVVGQGVVNSNGTWEVTVEPLADGVYTITTVQEDLAGNVSAASAALTITVDGLAPQRPTLDLTADTGLSGLDNVTNSANPVPFTVTAEVGSRVLIKNGETVIADFLMPALSTTVGLTLAEGTHLLSVEAFDAAGNRSAQSEELVVTVDRTPPGAPGVLDLLTSSDTYDNVAGLNGPNWTNTDNITFIRQPAFGGTGVEAGSVIRVMANGVVVGQGVVNTDGSWEVTVEPLADGVYQMTAVVEDLAGNVSATSQPLTITVDGLAPQRPTLDLWAADDSGRSSLDNVTFAGNPLSFTVTAEAGSRVMIKSGETVIDDFIMVGDSTTRTLSFANDGTYLLSVEAFDAAGNRSAQSEELILTVDRTAPLAPSVPDLLAVSDTGSSNSDNFTSINQPAFQGTGEANSLVRVYANGELVGQGVVTSFGAWEVTVEPLKPGQHLITAELEDLAGNIGPRSAALTIVIDPYEPNDTRATATILGSLPKVTVNDVLLHNAADVDMFKITAHSTGMLIVNAFSADAIALRVLDVNGNVIATGTQSTVTAGLDVDRIVIPVVSQREYFIEVTYNGGTPTEPVTHVAIYDLEIENFAAPVPTDVTLDPNDDSGRANNDFVTLVDDSRLLVKADLELFADAGMPILTAAQALAGNVPGAAVEVFVNGVSVGFADPFFGLSNLFELRLDVQGGVDPNVGEWQLTIPLNTGGRTAPPRVVAVDNAGYLQIVRAAVRIFDGQVQARTQMSPELNVHFDPNAPDANLVTIELASYSDTGIVGDGITSITKPAFVGNAEANAKIWVYAQRLNASGNPVGGAQLIGQTIVGSDRTDDVVGDGLGHWEITSEPLADGLYAITARLEDVAGNVSTMTAPPVLITVDATLPQRPTIDLVGPDVVSNDVLGVAPIFSDTGRSTTDNITQGYAADPNVTGNRLVQVRVSAEPGSTVVIKDGEEVIDTFVMPAGIGFVFRTLSLSQNPHPLSAEAFDTAANRSMQSEELLVLIDMTAPNAGLVTASLAAESDSGLSNSDRVTKQSQLIFHGVAEANATVRLFANGVLVGQGTVHSDQSNPPTTINPPGTNMLGSWQVTTQSLVDGGYNITLEIEDAAGNVTAVNPVLNPGNTIDVVIDTVPPNKPYLDLLDDTGRHSSDNVTQDNTPSLSMTSQDPNVALAQLLQANNLVFRLFLRPEGGAETKIFDSGLTSQTLLTQTLAQLPDGVHNLKLEIEDRAGNLSLPYLLTVTIDTQAYLGTGSLHPDSDTGVPGVVATFSDRITSVYSPSFYGTAEANNVVTVVIDGVAAGTAVAVPLDGNGAFQPPQSPYQLVQGNWRIDTSVVLADGPHSVVFTYEDLAGNRISSQPLQIFVDTAGPQITDVNINSRTDGYNIWSKKAGSNGNDTLVPTPLVNRLVIDVQDLPARSTGFLYQALLTPNAVDPGHFRVVGDANGVIPIQSVTFTSDPVNNGAVATGYLTIEFYAPLPDDRFTLTISDQLTDPAGNRLDGESNAAAPNNSSPSLPSGNGVPGGDFVARFTVDSRPELGVYHSGSAWTDTNGNFVFDPNNPDFTNRDIVYTFGVTTDKLFVGNFASTSTPRVADGFDKLAAYGRIGSSFRWLIDWNNDGVPDLSINEPRGTTGYPVAGNFDGNPTNGDEVGLFAGHTWQFDTTGNYQLNHTLHTPNMAGLPIVGDFNGDGADDLGVWSDDRFTFLFTTGGVARSWVPGTEVHYQFGFIGTREMPVAADMDGDGIADIGLWVPDRAGVTPGEGAEWYFLVSGGVPLPTRIASEGGVAKFKPVPFGNDMFASFGEDFAVPLVGNFDPPVVPGSNVINAGWTNSVDPADVNGDGIRSPSDVIAMINDFNAGGVRELAGTRPASSLFLDVNGDGWFSPQDILQTITLLNQDAQASSVVPGGEGEAVAVTQITLPQSVVAQTVVVESSAVPVDAGTVRLNDIDAVFAEEDDEEELDDRFAAVSLTAGELDRLAADGDTSAWDDGLDAVIEEIFGGVAE